jgi:hypothetical protein
MNPLSKTRSQGVMRTQDRPPDPVEVESVALTTQELSDALKRRAPIALEDLQAMIGCDADD